MAPEPTLSGHLRGDKRAHERKLTSRSNKVWPPCKRLVVRFTGLRSGPGLHKRRPTYVLASSPSLNVAMFFVLHMIASLCFALLLTERSYIASPDEIG